MAERKPITPEQIGQTVYEKAIKKLNDIMPEVGFGSILACIGVGSYAAWKIYTKINENIKEHYEKNQTQVRSDITNLDGKTETRLTALAQDLKFLDEKTEKRVASLDEKAEKRVASLDDKAEKRVASLAQEFKSFDVKAETRLASLAQEFKSFDVKAETRLASLAQEFKSFDVKAETRLASLAQELKVLDAKTTQEISSGIKHLELRMENLETRMSNHLNAFKSDVKQMIQKLDNKQHQFEDHSRRLTLGEYRNRVTPFNLSNDCGKLSQATDIKSDYQGPSKVAMDELYKTQYKDKLTPTEFEQFSQLLASVCAAAGRNDGTLGPKIKELFSKPVVLKLLQLPKKL